MKSHAPDCADCPDKETSSVQPLEAGRILVTGASGFVGQNLCKALDKRGYKLRVLVRDDKADTFFKSLKAQIYKGDIRDKDVVDGACAGVEGVFHLASIVQQAGIPDREFWNVHVTATRNLLEAARKADAGRVVHCSTVGVLGHVADPPADEATAYNVEDIYQVTKAEGEKLALEFNSMTGLPITVVRPCAVYGPGDRRLYKLFKLIATGKFRMIGDGSTLIHPVYIDDLVDGMILAYESPSAVGKVYILGGARYVAVREWAEIIAREAGVALSSFSIPYTPVWLAAVACEAVCAPFAIEPPLFRRRVDFFVKNRAFSINKAKQELEFSPKTDLEKGAAKTIEWYRRMGWI
ncbi:UDP-glucose 4-epimerase [hydrothermal vent metagenome]|uniref:UDP-glucose 4-epimerase n=1 Tax=hydrothermal vent metagenome TaxID=652676 RepID=A0A3B1B9M1_9ZZZZ